MIVVIYATTGYAVAKTMQFLPNQRRQRHFLHQRAERQRKFDELLVRKHFKMLENSTLRHQNQQNSPSETQNHQHFDHQARLIGLNQ